MKKAGVVTLYGEFNYGNKLQNYAVVRCLEKWGYSADTFVVRSFKGKIFEKIQYLKWGFLGNFPIKNQIKFVRQCKFAKFSKKYLHKTYVKKVNEGISPKLSKKYDIFVSGSDQVWNPTFWPNDGIANDMLLGFAPAEKRYCFSPSFGVTEINEKWREKMTKELASFVSLSSREEAGANIIKELTRREARVTIDPTMMLDADEWSSIAREVADLPKEYALEYFLGKIPEDNEAYNEIPSGYKRIRLLDKSNPKIYTADPSEFIYLVSKASVIYTDSFHACVFSILFGKPFKVFERISGMKSMFSRIETLLSMFGLDARACIGKIVQVDADARDRVLREKRKEVEELFGGI